LRACMLACMLAFLGKGCNRPGPLWDKQASNSQPATLASKRQQTFPRVLAVQRWTVTGSMPISARWAAERYNSTLVFGRGLLSRSVNEGECRVAEGERVPELDIQRGTGIERAVVDVVVQTSTETKLIDVVAATVATTIADERRWRAVEPGRAATFVVKGKRVRYGDAVHAAVSFTCWSRTTTTRRPATSIWWLSSRPS